MKYLQKLSQSGDTIVETMLSMALLTLVLFTSWSAVNRAVQTSQAARKRIDMVNQLKEQAEVLKAKRDVYIADGTSFANLFTAYTDSNPSVNPCTDIVDASNNVQVTPTTGPSFYFAKDDTTKAVALTSGSKSVAGDPASRIWIQRKNGTSDGGKYIDFYIRGCWMTQGSIQKLDNSQILARLNV